MKECVIEKKNMTKLRVSALSVNFDNFILGIENQVFYGLIY